MKPDSKTIKRRDKEFQVAVLERDGMCQVCGRPACAAHHIIGRRYMATRWDINNGIALCVDCHATAHREPKLFMKWLDDRNSQSVPKNAQSGEVGAL